MHRTAAIALCASSALVGQSSYDFNSLNGSDVHPYTLLDGQDNWTEETYRAANRCGVTATLSHDGTQSLRFQEVGPGYGCDASRINDASWSYPQLTSAERNAFFQADLLVGYWGGSFGLAHDTSGNGKIRNNEPGERGVRFNVGTQTNVQLQLIAANGTSVKVPLANAGTVKGGDWLRIRVGMDLLANGAAGLGAVEVQNLSAGATDFTPVPGLQAVPLGLDPAAVDATNPAAWDAVWLHFEGATYGLDNIVVGRGLARAIPYGDGCGNPALGLRGVARPVLGNSASVETFAIPAGSPAVFLLIGAQPLQPGIDLTAIGMPKCYLHVSPLTSLNAAPTGPTALHTLAIPATSSLAGGSLYLQSAAVALGATPLGLVSSNAVRWNMDVR